MLLVSKKIFKKFLAISRMCSDRPKGYCRAVELAGCSALWSGVECEILLSYRCLHCWHPLAFCTYASYCAGRHEVRRRIISQTINCNSCHAVSCDWCP